MSLKKQKVVTPVCCALSESRCPTKNTPLMGSIGLFDSWDTGMTGNQVASRLQMYVIVPFAFVKQSHNFYNTLQMQTKQYLTDELTDDRWTDRQMDRQTDRQTDGQKDR